MASILARMRPLARRGKKRRCPEPDTSSASKRKKRSNSQVASSALDVSPSHGKLSAVLENGSRAKSSSDGQWTPVTSLTAIPFGVWCMEVGIKLHPRLYISDDSCAAIGVFAKGEIRKGEELAFIPRTAVLHSANSCLQLHKLVEEDQVLRNQLPDMNSWVPLLLSLMAEYKLKSESRWFPYLALVPNNEGAESALPLLWSKCERERLLQGTGVEEMVEVDLKKVEEDFELIVLPFMKRHPNFFRKTFHSLELYKKLVSFVMSYSFSDPEVEDVLQRTMMVPFVDLLNHHSNHHAELNYCEDHLELVAVRDIAKGEEVMNTYGALPNSTLLHTYGFTEPQNPQDTAFITSDALEDVYLKERATRVKKHQRWTELLNQELVEDKYTVDTSGDPEFNLRVLVKVLFAKTQEYDIMKQQLLLLAPLSPASEEEEEEKEEEESEEEEDQEGEEEEEEEVEGVSSEYLLCNFGINELEFLKRVTEHCLKQFPESYDSNLTTAVSDHLHSPRERHALHLCIGQQRCLLALMERLS